MERTILYSDHKPKKGENGLYEYVIQNEHKICGFFGKVGFFLSNGKKCRIVDPQDNSIIYPYTENAYQASKFTDIELRKTFQTISFESAIKLAWIMRKNIRDDWERVKLSEMKRVLEAKFSHPELVQKLMATGTKYLEETNHWEDMYWGVSNEIGENNLGKLLMEIREQKTNNL
jgi:predicted NAD-dependent protein-ADP-ribosyltransferase YbiA (DUF1768 family)